VPEHCDRQKLLPPPKQRIVTSYWCDGGPTAGPVGVTAAYHGFSTMVVTKEESVLHPKTNDKNGISTMNFISVLPSLPLCIPSLPTRWAEKGHDGALQTFSLWWWGGMVWQYTKIHTLLL